jgi:hypothetical protein
MVDTCLQTLPARNVRAEQSGHLPGPALETDAVDRGVAAEPLGRIPDNDDAHQVAIEDLRWLCPAYHGRRPGQDPSLAS